MFRYSKSIVAALLVALIAGLFAVPAAGVQAQGDDRVNCHEASPIVIYCSADGIDIYSTGGVFLLHVSDTVIDAVGVPDVNTMLGQTAGGGVRVYRLSSGEFQVNTVNGNQEYVAIWEGCHLASADLKAYSTWNWELLSDDDGCDFVEPVDAELPDLIVTDISYGFPLFGGGVNVTVTVMNQGVVDSGSFNTMLATGSCDGDFPQGLVGNLAPGASHSFSEVFVDGGPPCNLTATVDSGGQVTESNEANNTMTVLAEGEILF